jgi:hypothetical protein
MRHCFVACESAALKTNTSPNPLGPVMANRLIKWGVDANLTADQLTNV